MTVNNWVTCNLFELKYAFELFWTKTTCFLIRNKRNVNLNSSVVYEPIVTCFIHFPLRQIDTTILIIKAFSYVILVLKYPLLKKKKGHHFKMAQRNSFILHWKVGNITSNTCYITLLC